MGKKVLVVDDSVIIRQLLKVAISKIDSFEPITIIEAVNGLEGCQKFETNQIDLIITDINMPVMDGFEMVGKIRSLPIGKNLPIIVVSANTDEADFNRAFELGVNEYLNKPISFVRFKEVVSRLLNYKVPTAIESQGYSTSRKMRAITLQ